jgi:hypothetical protein
MRLNFPDFFILLFFIGVFCFLSRLKCFFEINALRPAEHRSSSICRLPLHHIEGLVLPPAHFYTKKKCISFLIKGTVSRDFCFRFFSWIIFPQAPENNIRVISNFFSKIRGDIRKSRCTTCINATGGTPWASKKFETALMGYSQAWKKLILEKKPEIEISWHCPFKGQLI